jgi:hypothetical protein
MQMVSGGRCARRDKRDAPCRAAAPACPSWRCLRRCPRLPRRRQHPWPPHRAWATTWRKRTEARCLGTSARAMRRGEVGRREVLQACVEVRRECKERDRRRGSARVRSEERRARIQRAEAAALFDGFPHETRQRRAERALLPRCHHVRSAWPPCLWPAAATPDCAVRSSSRL